MSDYFLNKIYDSLLSNKQPKTKSTFHTLKESYRLVYEQDNKQQIAFNVNQSVVQQRQAWSPEQQQLFKYKTAQGETAGEGTGRGEYAVASVLTGSTSLDQVKELISGGSKSYDVSWPSKTTPTYKFEVKELDKFGEGSNTDVRIGTEGDPLGREVIGTITQLLRDILEEYNDVSPEEQKQIDQEIISYSLDTKLPPEPEIGRGGKEKATSIAKRQKYEIHKTQQADWSLRGYIGAILNKPSELGSALMFGDKQLVTSNFRDPERKKYCLISIKRLFQSIEEIEHILRDEKSADETNPRVVALRNILRANYTVPGETEEIENLKAYLDSEAEKIDKKLTKVKCKTTGEGCTTGKTFYNDLKHLSLLQSINKLQEKVYSPQTIRSLFPSDLTGFFAVNEKGFYYVPVNKIGELITFHSISMGKPKIRLK